MFSLLRIAFWLALLIFLIPINEDVARQSAGEQKQPIGAFEAVGAAQATFSDMGGFCGRNPTVCDIGERIGHTFALKAKSGALWVYNWLDENDGEENTVPQAPESAVVDVPVEQRGTLSGSDLEPGWQGPAESVNSSPNG